MVDYEYYVNQYLGSAIPESAFSGVAAQAQRHLDRFKRIYRVESSGAAAESFAVCAMAETLWHNRNKRVASANVGGVSVHYNPDKSTLNRELYEKAGIYLDIYRGVEA